MTDYQSVWIKWMTFLGMDFPFRKKFLDALHIEVTRGFDAVTRIASEQIAAAIDDKKIFEDAKDDIETILAFSVFSGYSLFLVSEGIDPEKENLIAKEQTSELGSLWMENYDQDNNAKLLDRIDPILSIFLEKQTQLRMNDLFLGNPEIQKLPYGQVAKIETFTNWVAHQGFIFGILENDISQKKQKEKE